MVFSQAQFLLQCGANTMEAHLCHITKKKNHALVNLDYDISQNDDTKTLNY